MLQPELNKIQRKYEGRDDQASKMRMAQEQQQLMKKYDVNPGSMMLSTVHSVTYHHGYVHGYPACRSHCKWYILRNELTG